MAPSTGNQRLSSPLVSGGFSRRTNDGMSPVSLARNVSSNSLSSPVIGRHGMGSHGENFLLLSNVRFVGMLPKGSKGCIFSIFSHLSVANCQEHMIVAPSVVAVVLCPCSSVPCAGMFDPSRPSLYVCQRERRGTVLSKISDLRGIYRSVSQVIQITKQRQGSAPNVLRH